MIKAVQKIIKYLKIPRHIKILALFQTTLAAFFAFFPIFVFAGVMDTINFATSPLSSIANLLIYGVYSIITFILGGLVDLSASFMEWSLKLTMTSPEGIINVGWRVSLGLANNLFILILLAIAIGTILGLPQINKKLLPMFLMIALLINFSMVIGNIVIDSSNVLASYFLNGIQQGGNAIGDQLMNSLKSGEIQKQLGSVVNGDAALKTEAQKAAAEEAAKKARQKAMQDVVVSTGDGEFIETDSQGEITTHTWNGVTSDPIDSVGVVLLKSIYIIFIQLVIIVTFLFGGIYLLSRTFWLWLLLMLAPLAWIAKLIPKAEGYWSKWWEMFMAKAFFAPVYLFMVYLAVTIATASGKALSGTLSSNGVNASAVIQMLTVAFLMMAGIHFGQKAGGGFANGIIKYGKGMAGKYGKELNKLRSKGFIEKQLEKLKPENLAKYTAMGLSKVPGAGAVIGFGEETREKLQEEKLQKQQKRESVYRARENLKNLREGKSELHEDLKKARQTGDQKKIEELTTKIRDEELGLLKKIRQGTTTGGKKFSTEDIEKFLKDQKEKESGVPSEEKESGVPPKEGKT